MSSVIHDMHGLLRHRVHIIQLLVPVVFLISLEITIPKVGWVLVVTLAKAGCNVRFAKIVRLFLLIGSIHGLFTL